MDISTHTILTIEARALRLILRYDILFLYMSYQYVFSEYNQTTGHYTSYYLVNVLVEQLCFNASIGIETRCESLLVCTCTERISRQTLGLR